MNKGNKHEGMAEERCAKIPVNFIVIHSSYLPNFISEGIQKWFRPWLNIFMCIFALSVFMNYLPFLKDSTDPEFWRSGMKIKTDHLTGCQYLASSKGLTPRLDINGSQICEARK